VFEVMARVSNIFTNFSKKLLVNLFIVEFILSAIKVAGLVGFIILGVIIDCGGVGPQGYLGAKYWRTYISF
jgi:amino acid permease